MEFKSGDDVVHPVYGVGNIARLEERRLAETEMRLYYVLTVDKNTVWVPVSSDGGGSLRAVTPEKDLDRYRAVLKSRPVALDRDQRKRRLEVNQRLKQGSFQVLCEVVRDLTARGWGKTTNDGDDTILLQARTNLWREWAAAARLPMSKVIEEVGALLEAGRELHAA